jgi:hypothetical protein
LLSAAPVPDKKVAVNPTALADAMRENSVSASMRAHCEKVATRFSFSIILPE